MASEKETPPDRGVGSEGAAYRSQSPFGTDLIQKEGGGDVLVN
jgi:hypothetical protein